MFTNTEAIQLAESILWALGESSNHNRFKVLEKLIREHLQANNLKKLQIAKDITALEEVIADFNNNTIYWGCAASLEQEDPIDIESIKNELKEKKAKQSYLFELRDIKTSSAFKIILNRFLKKLIKTIEIESNPQIITQYFKSLELQEATLTEIVQNNERIYEDYLNATKESGMLLENARRLGGEAIILNQAYLRLCEKPLSKDDCLALQNTLTAITRPSLPPSSQFFRETTSAVALDYTEFSENEKQTLINDCRFLLEKNPLLAEKCYLLFNYQKQALWKRAFSYPIITLKSNIPPDAYTKTIRHILNHYLDKSSLHKGYKEAILLYFNARISMIRRLQYQVANYPALGLMTQYLQDHADLERLISTTEGSITTVKNIIAVKITPGIPSAAPVSTALLDEKISFFSAKEPETTVHPSGSLALSNS